MWPRSPQHVHAASAVLLPTEGCLSSLTAIICCFSTWTHTQSTEKNLQKQHFDKKLVTSWKYSKYSHVLTVVFYRKDSRISHHFLIVPPPPQKSVKKREGEYTNFTPAYWKTNYHDEFLVSKTSFHLRNLWDTTKDLIIIITTHSAEKAPIWSFRQENHNVPGHFHNYKEIRANPKASNFPHRVQECCLSLWHVEKFYGWTQSYRSFLT